ncbi:FAD-binding oxidoreductase [Raineyella fluvialis]|uniref:FAD-binding protein n=1 Tax=Raineyella fluvialis TaxID=2662261 RepID=A0A5Q2FA16_9ACTN|nr:FAD-binding oxidoreductase [Raineyella fluvialis]QGF23221.1 FAD-binding protein [Raineyella fluvialis]
MTGVKHQKWWGWGVEGIGFDPEGKPAFAPFVKKQIGLDVSKPGIPPKFEDLDVPAPIIDGGLREQLLGIVGERFLLDDDLDRIVHTFGKGVRDLIRIRRGDLRRVVDVVVYPADETQVQAVVDACVEADAVLIPFGGGSNIVGALEPMPTERRTVVSVDLGRMAKVLEIDDESGLARIQAGALGPQIEEQLGRRGWTMGHFPDSFTHSTLGGWIATRSTGMQSDKYGDIADIVKGLRAVRHREVLALRPLPSTSSGPSVREMILGSEGRLGIITEAWVNVHRVPEVREIVGYFFPDFSSGLRAMKEINDSDAHVTVSRVSDANETQFSFATQRAQRGVKKIVMGSMFGYLKRRGWDLDQMCLSYIGFEGGRRYVKRNQAIVKEIVKANGGIVVGTGVGSVYDSKKFQTPYIRDFLLDRGATADVSETATPWANLQNLYDTTTEAARAAFEKARTQGFVMCHFAHSYHSGACLYFTFALPDTDAANTYANYDLVKRAIQQNFMDNAATVSHHHGVGSEHAPWLDQDISVAGTKLHRVLLEGADPGRNFNPGKILHDGKPGVAMHSSDAPLPGGVPGTPEV